MVKRMSRVFFTLKSMYFKTVNKMQILIRLGLDPVFSGIGPVEMNQNQVHSNLYATTSRLNRSLAI